MKDSEVAVANFGTTTSSFLVLPMLITGTKGINVYKTIMQILLLELKSTPFNSKPCECKSLYKYLCMSNVYTSLCVCTIIINHSEVIFKVKHSIIKIKTKKSQVKGELWLLNALLMYRSNIDGRGRNKMKWKLATSNRITWTEVYILCGSLPSSLHTLRPLLSLTEYTLKANCHRHFC